MFLVKKVNIFKEKMVWEKRFIAEQIFLAKFITSIFFVYFLNYHIIKNISEDFSQNCISRVYFF